MVIKTKGARENSAGKILRGNSARELCGLPRADLRKIYLKFTGYRFLNNRKYAIISLTNQKNARCMK